MSDIPEMLYVDPQGRVRSLSTGRFAKFAPDEICPNGCERYGEWWVAEDCAEHFGGAS